MDNKFLKSKAAEIIKTLTKDERKSFELFLSSPYFNTNVNITKLYKQVLKVIDDKEDDNVNEKEVYEKVFKGRSFNYGTMRNLMSALYQLAEEFLIINSTRENPEYKFDNDIKVLTEYSKRFLDTHYKLKYKKTDSETFYSIPGYDYFDKKSKLIYTKHIFDSQRSEISKYKDTLYPKSLYNLAKVISILSEDVAGNNYLKTILNQNSGPSVSSLLFKNLNSENFLKEISAIDKICYDHINLEFKHIKLYLEPYNTDNYFELKKIISKNIDRFSNSDRNYLICKMLNFVTRLFNEGNQKLIYELSDLRKFQLKKVKFNSENVDSLQLHIFVNIVDIFRRTEEVKEVENFTIEFSKSVEEINRKTAFQYGMCRVEMSKGNYNKALEYIKDIKLSNFILKYQVKMLLLEIYYELGYFETGLSVIDALKHNLKSIDEFPPAVKEQYYFLLRIMERIYKMKSNPERYSILEIDFLLLEINKKILRTNNWYVRKLEELKGNYEKKTAAGYAVLKKI
ncbi:MAG: hypothetical protein ABIY50_00185 [Ignavibacteria bacterium]